MSACSPRDRNTYGRCRGGSPARRSTPKAGVPSCLPCRRASSTSAARRRRRTSAPIPAYVHSPSRSTSRCSARPACGGWRASITPTRWGWPAALPRCRASRCSTRCSSTSSPSASRAMPRAWSSSWPGGACSAACRTLVSRPHGANWPTSSWWPRRSSIPSRTAPPTRMRSRRCCRDDGVQRAPHLPPRAGRGRIPSEAKAERWNPGEGAFPRVRACGIAPSPDLLRFAHAPLASRPRIRSGAGSLPARGARWSKLRWPCRHIDGVTGMLNRQGRPTGTGEGGSTAPATFTGNRALRIEEALIFEIGRPDVCGVDFDEPHTFAPRLGALERNAPIGLPGLSEPETVRHYVRLSRNNYGIDSGPFPLGSCTMKHNPRLNEKMARLPGFADIHPLQPLSTVAGALELIRELARWLTELTGMPAAALAARNERRACILVPESAHGTNPATAALLGYRVEPVPARADGTVDADEVRRKLSGEVAAIMLTNPNTCGLFERDI